MKRILSKASEKGIKAKEVGLGVKIYP